MNLNITNTIWAHILPMLAMPVSLFLVKQFIDQVPESLIEAARIDGASYWQAFRYITLPLLRPSILVALLWRIIDTFRIFDVVFTLTGGGPASATEVISLYAYRNGFQKFDLGYASSISYAMIAMILIVAFILFRSIGRSEQIF